MKTQRHLKYKIIVSFLLIFLANISHSQTAICKNSITVSTNIFSCAYNIIPSDINNGSSDYDNLTIDQSVLTTFGPNIVTLTASKNTGETSSCTCTVNLEDKVGPVVVVGQNIVIALNDQNEFHITPELINVGSYDRCSNITMSVEPELIDCSSPNPLLVTLTVTDASGNSHQGWAHVIIQQNKNRITSLACNDSISFGVPPVGVFEITADSLLDGSGPYACPSFYKVVLTYNNIQLPTPFVSYADVGKTFDYKVTDPETNISCWGKVTIVGLDCTNSFNVCDSASRCEPLGDCSSGHSSTDDIEWPCDITIDNAPSYLYTSPTPKKIADYLNLPLSEVKPLLTNGAISNDKCVVIIENITATVIAAENKIKFLYTYKNGLDLTQQSYDYSQYITLIPNTDISCEVCDTLPWNSPAGNCGSGHTLNDAVEWPGDLDVDFIDVSPYNLSQNPDINPNDVAPVLNNACGIEWEIEYFQSSIETYPSTYLILRTWVIKSEEVNQIHFYTQKININIPPISNERSVCFGTMHEIPITDVKIGINTFSGSDGCSILTYSEANKVIAPAKVDSDFQSGLDIEDVIMLKENIFKKRVFNKLHLSIADMNNDTQLNNQDVKIMYELLTNKIANTSFYTSPWQFFDADQYYYKNTASHSANISSPFAKYEFKGMKLGDLNDSYGRNESLPNVSILALDDQVLNEGQTYDVKLFTKQAIRMNGMQLAIAKNDAFEITAAVGLSLNIQVVDKGDHYLLIGLADDQYINENGLPTDPTTSVFKIILKANRNAVLHDIFELYNTGNKMVEGGDTGSSKIQLNYNGSIPTSALDFIVDKIAMYPNPTTGMISIESPDAEISAINIYNFSGQLMKNIRNSSYKSIDVSELPNGFYTVNLTMKDGRKVAKKMIKI